MERKFKLMVRYIMLAYFMWLSYRVTTVEWLDYASVYGEGIVQIIIGFVLASTTLIINKHFETKIRKDDDNVVWVNIQK